MKTYTAKQAVKFFLKHVNNVVPDAAIYVDYGDEDPEGPIPVNGYRFIEATEACTAADECWVKIVDAEQSEVGVYFLVMDHTFLDRAEVVCDYRVNETTEAIWNSMAEEAE